MQWVINGMLARGMLSVIYGRPGSGKSLVALDIALTIAQRAPVVYLAAEAIPEIRDRIRAWYDLHCLSPGSLFVGADVPDLRRSGDIHALGSAIRKIGACTLIIDPLAELLGISGWDENSAGDMGQAIAALRALMHAAGDPALLVVHHAGWSDAHMRGASSLQAAARVVVRVSGEEGAITLAMEKANNGAPWQERYLGIVPYSVAAVIAPRSNIASDRRTISSAQKRILEALGSINDGGSFTDLLHETEMARSTLHKALRALLKRGFIAERATKRKRYRLTAEGKSELERIELTGELPGDHTVRLVNDFLWSVNRDAVPQSVAPSVDAPCDCAGLAP